MGLLKNAWRWQKKFARYLGNFQARLLLTIFYFLLLLPFGLAVRLLADPLRTKKLPTGWLEHPGDRYDWRWARKQ